jgi:hypothetical protein
MLRDGQTEMFVGAGRKSSRPLYRYCDIPLWLFAPFDSELGDERTLAIGSV